MVTSKATLRARARWTSRRISAKPYRCRPKGRSEVEFGTRRGSRTLVCSPSAIGSQPATTGARQGATGRGPPTNGGRGLASGATRCPDARIDERCVLYARLGVALHLRESSERGDPRAQSRGPDRKEYVGGVPLGVWPTL